MDLFSKRVAIYARYSTEHQREASLEDQIALCKERAEREGWQIVKIYQDAAIYGKSLNRPNYQNLLSDAKNNHFDIVLASGTDRFSRDMGDSARFFELMTFHRIIIVTLTEGKVDKTMIGFKSIMSEMMISDVAFNTKRGLRGRVKLGKNPGGNAYGYKVIDNGPEGEHGDREIIEAEAKIVRRIFEDYANGISPRKLAQNLNAENIPGIAGRTWKDTTIRGQVSQQTGILNNELYIGQIVWNKRTFSKHPETRKRLSRLNPKEFWVRKEVPDLRIISDELWDSVKKRQKQMTIVMARDENGNALNRAHRKKHLLSGLIFCKSCGSKYVITGVNQYGCSNYKRGSATCNNNRKIDRKLAERQVLKTLKTSLYTPENMECFAKAYKAEQTRLYNQKNQEHEHLSTELKTIETKINNLVEALACAKGSAAISKALAQHEARLLELQNKMQETPATQKPITLTPNLHNLYKSRINDLQKTLSKEGINSQAAEIIQKLIGRVEVIPRGTDTRGADLKVIGNLEQAIELTRAS